MIILPGSVPDKSGDLIPLGDTNKYLNIYGHTRTGTRSN